MKPTSPSKILQQFRIIALLEGLSFLILLFIAMPFKYVLDLPQIVSVVGMAHGVLFVAYIIWLYMAHSEQKWTIKKSFLAFMASLIPFGTFWFDRRFLSQNQNQND